MMCSFAGNSNLPAAKYVTTDEFDAWWRSHFGHKGVALNMQAHYVSWCTWHFSKFGRLPDKPDAETCDEPVIVHLPR